MKADEPQEIAIEALEAVGAEEEAIDRRWHSHRHDDQGGSAGEKLRRHSGRALINRKAGAQNLFEKTLQASRNVSEPERIKDDEMIHPANICLGIVEDPKSVVEGMSGGVSVDLGGRRNIIRIKRKI